MQTVSLNYTGSVQTISIPNYCGLVKIECYGASGGQIGDGISGKGGYIVGIFDSTKYKTKTLYAYVGQQGANAGKGSASWNGGASSSNSGGCPGGGATDIRLTNGNWNDTTSLNSRIIVAGGGGGSDDSSSGSGISNKGGDGGGLTGLDGACYTGSGANGKGGTQVAGGQGGSTSQYGTASSGTLGIGGSPTSYGGGGGGGYYGGGGGTGNSGNPDGCGGGGSSYATGLTGCVNHSSGILLSSCSTQTGINTGNGKIIITMYYGYKFIIQQNTDLYYTDGTMLAKFDSLPYSLDKFNNKGMDDLSNINSNIVSKVDSQRYKIAMYKK